MKVLALLDPPSTQSFGMVPFVVDDGLDDLYICIGLSGSFGSRNFISKKEFSVLVRDGHAINVSHLRIPVTFDLKNPLPVVAGWLGSEFAKKAAAVGVPAPDIPHGRKLPDGTGLFWFEDSGTMHRRLRSWIRAAAPRAFKEKNKDIVRLMEWAMPLAPETLAALWHVRDSRADKERELNWQLSCSNRKATTRKSLIAAHKKVMQQYV
ncbi:MAG: hypothetical protein KGI60_02295 [Patescibacteria group bacterium]|nr:hypothetical protein [Patescibacteria group bacterium]